MAFRKTNKIDKADHQVVKPTNSDQEKTWLEVLKARMAAEIEARKPKE